MTIPKKLPVILISILIIAAAFTAGYKANTYYANKQKQSATNFAQDFVSKIVAGKSADVYPELSQRLASKETQTDFTKSLADTKSAKPSYDPASVLEQNNVLIYSQRVTGLDADKNGSTTATFAVIVAKENGALKVRKLSVQ
jgi:hypothetical protein